MADQSERGTAAEGAGRPPADPLDGGNAGVIRARALAIDPRDVARIRTEARLVELALVGLLAEVRATMPVDRPLGISEAGMAITTAREFAERCQVALSVAMMRLPGSNEYKPGGSH